MAIPFKSFRYSQTRDYWQINFSRNDLKQYENSAWSPAPRNANIANLAFTGRLQFDAPPPKPGANVTLIPYGIGGANVDYQADGKVKGFVNGGMDAKIAVTPSLNLDLTLNPDFSQVDVDQQVTNLSRFSIMFPERRNFFIENSDLFSRFGFRRVRPFFSRKIGTRSYFGLIGVNRQAFMGTNPNWSDYNRIVGADFDLRTHNNVWMGKVFCHRSFTPNQSADAFAHGSWVGFNHRNVFAMMNHEHVGKYFITDVGFVPRGQVYNSITEEYVRRSYWRLEPMVNVKLYPAWSKINWHGPGVYWSYYADRNWVTTESFVQIKYDIRFASSAGFTISSRHNHIRLQYPTDVTFSGKEALPAGEYQFSDYEVRLGANRRKPFVASGRVRIGDYYTGHKNTYRLDLNYRWQPWGIFSLGLEQNEIVIDSNCTSYLTLISPKIEFSFTRNVFLVYSDNYGVSGQFGADDYLWMIKNRSVVVKMAW